MPVARLLRMSSDHVGGDAGFIRQSLRLPGARPLVTLLLDAAPIVNAHSIQLFPFVHAAQK